MLGFKSWTDYVAEVVGKDMTKLPVDDRRQIVELLAGEGMSQRQIAAAVGVSQKTVDRDLDQVSHNDSPDDQVITEPKPITGRDGKTYRPKPPQPQQESKQRRWPLDVSALGDQHLMLGSTAKQCRCVTSVCDIRYAIIWHAMSRRQVPLRQ